MCLHICYLNNIMSHKNILANKKRKKIKFDVTSGSISGYLHLISSADAGEMMKRSSCSASVSAALSDAQLLNSSATTNVNNRLSTEFDDSFDLFVPKKITDVDNLELSNTKWKSPLKNSKIDHLKIHVPCGKSRDTSERLSLPNGKCNYFNRNDSFSFNFPCPFCFKFEKNISVHINSNCARQTCSNEKILSRLIKVHSDYWNQRRILGIPDPDTCTFDQDVFFKVPGRHSVKNISESLNCCDSLFLKLSKVKRNKYVLLRQSKSERENKITEKLAMVLTGIENVEMHGKQADESSFKTANRTLCSQHLTSLLCKEFSFWKKSSLNADPSWEEMYYVKALSPFIKPYTYNKNRVYAEENVEALSSEEDCSAKLNLFMNEVGSSFPQECSSNMKDVHFTEVNWCELSPRCAEDDDMNDVDCLSNDWEKLFNSPDLSDVTVLLDCGSLFAHSVVFRVRSIEIFRSISSGSGRQHKLLDWKDFPFEAGAAFIKFIYTGKTKHFESMKNCELKYVKELCDKYDQYRLQLFISNVMQLKSSTADETSEGIGINNDHSFLAESENPASPDMFPDYSLNLQTEFKESANASSSKRKLQLSSQKVSELSSYKKLKRDSVHVNTTDVSNELRVDSDEVNDDDKSTGSANTVVDVIPLKSVETGSPGEFENSDKSSLLQCPAVPLLSPVTLSPVLVSPNNNDALKTPPYFETTTSDAVDDFPVEKEKVSNSPQDNSFYDNDVYNFNGFTDLPNTCNKSDVNLIESERNSVSRKNSLDKYFDDSLALNFVDHLSGDETERLDEKCSQGPLYQSTPQRHSRPENFLKTPTLQILVSDQVTPLLNYSNIISPELKGELRKYGLKPDMDRNKAKTLLKYIYELIHPVVVPPDNVSDSQPGPACNGQQNSQSSTDVTELDFSNDDCENVMDFNSELTQDSVNSQEPSSYLNKNELLQSVSSFIRNDPVLFDSTLHYVPVWLSKFHTALKEVGVKCTRNDLMDVLDQLCVTFRTERKVNGKKQPNI